MDFDEDILYNNKHKKSVEKREQEYIDLLTKRARDEILNNWNMELSVETLTVDNTPNFCVSFKCGTIVTGNENNFIFEINGGVYRVGGHSLRSAVYKNNSKNVRETVNRLIPFVKYLSENYRKMDPKKIRKIAEKNLSK